MIETLAVGSHRLAAAETCCQQSGVTAAGLPGAGFNRGPDGVVRESMHFCDTRFTAASSLDLLKYVPEEVPEPEPEPVEDGLSAEQLTELLEKSNAEVSNQQTEGALCGRPDAPSTRSITSSGSR